MLALIAQQGKAMTEPGSLEREVMSFSQRDRMAQGWGGKGKRREGKENGKG